MADQNTEQSDKTEKATPHKLREARKQGNVSKTIELNTATAVAVSLILVFTIGPQFINNVLGMCKEILINSSNTDITISSANVIMKNWLLDGISILSPILIVFFLNSLITNFLQVGAIFSFHPIKPNLNRLNPVSGFKNKFSKRLIWDLFKTVLKFILLMSVTALFLFSVLPDFMRFNSLPSAAIKNNYIFHVKGLILSLLVVLIIAAVIDLIYSRKEYSRKLMMSKREVKEEIKRREGDPSIRAKRKELESELRKRASSLENVHDADVIVTNPTRFAIILKYNRSEMAAPVITGMGAGEMAKAIRNKAMIHKVPIIRSPKLARLLYKKGSMNNPIPRESFPSVAKVYKKIYEINSEVPKV